MPSAVMSPMDGRVDRVDREPVSAAALATWNAVAESEGVSREELPSSRMWRTQWCRRPAPGDHRSSRGWSRSRSCRG